MYNYIRPFCEILRSRLREKSPLIQAILGPRQVGKTTGIQQLIHQSSLKSSYITADDIPPLDARLWLTEHWGQAKKNGQTGVLVVDEIQKVENWSEIIKKLWDETDLVSRPKLVLLGSSSWSLQAGLRESLAGRYELIRASHWEFIEAQQAFGASFEEHLIFGGYPKVLEMRADKERAMNYLRDSIYAPVIGKDLLAVKEIKKPALLRQIFELVVLHPAQELSYRKMLGQLQDSGNIETAKHYLDLLEAAFLIRCLEKYSGSTIVQKSSSPKLITLAPCFHTLFAGIPAPENTVLRGRLMEQLVGQALTTHFSDVFYWREGNDEVDFVVKDEGRVIAVEVKSGRTRSLNGYIAFREKFKKAAGCVVSKDNILEFVSDPKAFLRR